MTQQLEWFLFFKIINKSFLCEFIYCLEKLKNFCSCRCFSFFFFVNVKLTKNLRLVSALGKRLLIVVLLDLMIYHDFFFSKKKEKLNYFFFSQILCGNTKCKKLYIFFTVQSGSSFINIK